jgi:hypothetical protein
MPTYWLQWEPGELEWRLVREAGPILPFTPHAPNATDGALLPEITP